MFGKKGESKACSDDSGCVGHISSQLAFPYFAHKTTNKRRFRPVAHWFSYKSMQNSKNSWELEILFNLCLCLKPRRIEPLKNDSPGIEHRRFFKKSKVLEENDGFGATNAQSRQLQLRNFAHSCLSCKLERVGKKRGLLGMRREENEECLFTCPWPF